MTMKKYIATLLILMVVGLMGLANAQMSTMVKAQVPFEFVANGKAMPGGECTISVDVYGRTALSINSGNQHVFAFSISDASPNARKRTALVFHQYGDRYFLTGIERENANGYQLPASKLERELQARNVPWHVFTLVASAK